MGSWNRPPKKPFAKVTRKFPKSEHQGSDRCNLATSSGEPSGSHTHHTPGFRGDGFRSPATSCWFRRSGDWEHSFPKQFTVGVFNSFLRGVRLFPGALRMSPSSVCLSPDVSLLVSGAPGPVCFFICFFYLFPRVAGCFPALQMCLLLCLPLSSSLAAGVWLLLFCIHAFGRSSTWRTCWRYFIWLVYASPLSNFSLHVSPSLASLAGGVGLSGCLSSLVSLHLSPSLLLF